jgi:hypothetical protein
MASTSRAAASSALTRRLLEPEPPVSPHSDAGGRARPHPAEIQAARTTRLFPNPPPLRRRRAPMRIGHGRRRADQE